MKIDKYGKPHTQKRKRISSIILVPRNKSRQTDERVEPAPFTIVAPFAEQACDLVKHDCHFTLLSLSPGWEITGSQNRPLPAATGRRGHWNKLQPGVTTRDSPGAAQQHPHPLLIQ